ncbi:fungal mating-type pheromone [Ancylostoma ceylanicum]|uniref:Fungal mating-type pheromone n=1 Tax=Ancylostoma ceylanicum TaxID=53326 RepID=A0A0D6LAN7_9BILA|nr:fungal mating-type pheromone [Ancylostoma ceylanicum]
MSSATTLPPQTPTTAVILQERTTVAAPKSYCPPDAVVTNGECRPRGSPGAACLMNSQCYNGTICVNSICTHNSTPTTLHHQSRKANNTAVKGKPLSSVTINRQCADDTQCSEGAKCQTGRCMCDGEAVLHKAHPCGQHQKPALSYTLSLVECIGGVRCPVASSCTFSAAAFTYLCCYPAQANQSRCNTKLVETVEDEAVTQMSRRTEADGIPVHAAASDV